MKRMAGHKPVRHQHLSRKTIIYSIILGTMVLLAFLFLLNDLSN